MMSSEKLAVRLDRAEDAVAQATDTAVAAHRDAPDTWLEQTAMDELAAAVAERDMAQAHLNAALEREAHEGAL